MAVANQTTLRTGPSARHWSADEFEAMRAHGLFRGQDVELIDGVVYELHRDSEPTPRRWTVDEYYAMADRGLFADQRVELIGGEIVVVSPQSPRHFATLDTIADILRGIFEGHWVRTQAPLALGLEDHPEPDIAVVPGPLGRYRKEHPSSAVLAVEVSYSTLPGDRNDKASLYARAGIQEYWVVNLIDEQVEVHRDPVADPAQRFGSRYSTVTVVKPGESIAPLAAPDARVAVADLLP